MFLKSVAIVFCFSLTAALADDPITQDIPGAKDNPLLQRYEGSFIFQYSQKEFDEYSIALGKGLNPSGNDGKTSEKEQRAEGKVTRISYVVPNGRSTLEVFRNYENELKAKGFQTLFIASKEETGYDFQRRYAGIYSQVFEYADFDPRYIAAKLSGPDGDVYASVFVVGYDIGTTGDLKLEKHQPLVQVDIVESKPMEEKMVQVSAEKMASSIETTGRVALYGIYFDFSKAEVKPESAGTLEQIAKLLSSDPSLKLLVTGHTDNVGSFESNRALSERRAQAVVREIVTRYNISNERLFPFGVSFAAPAAPNDSEENRAKNRRVELVRM
ncbi:MAG: OmpA family protein [Verrucomicrobiota bacterium]|nr:OmpA family protein [Verrucomicrobiota bacterium]